MPTPTNTHDDNQPDHQKVKVDEKVADALHQAEHDIEQDPDFNPPTKDDDLDEGEYARKHGDDDKAE